MLVTMQPPPTTTASAVRGTRVAATVSRIECTLIVISFAAFLFPCRHRYRPRMTILYLRGLPMRGRAGHVEAWRRRRTGPGRHRGLRRCRLQRPAPRGSTAQRDSHRDERHRPPVHGGGLDPGPRRGGFPASLRHDGRESGPEYGDGRGEGDLGRAPRSGLRRDARRPGRRTRRLGDGPRGPGRADPGRRQPRLRHGALHGRRTDSAAARRSPASAPAETRGRRRDVQQRSALADCQGPAADESLRGPGRDHGPTRLRVGRGPRPLGRGASASDLRAGAGVAIRDGRGSGEAPMFRRSGGGIRVPVVHLAAGGDQSRDRADVRPRAGQGRGRNPSGGPPEIPARRHRMGEHILRDKRGPHRRPNLGRHVTCRRPMEPNRMGSSGGCSGVARGEGPLSSIGKEIRIRRVLSDGKALIVAMDHGVSSGPLAGLEDIRKAVANVAKGGATAVVLHKGSVRFAKDYFDEKLALILHLSASTSLSPRADRKVAVTRVEEAISYGADAVSVHVNLGGEDDDRMLGDLGTAATDCDRLGFPLLAMMYARGPAIRDPYDVDVVRHAARVGAELGADLVKTTYTGSAETFREVVRGCSVPVVVAGGPKLDSDQAILEMVAGGLAAGAAGVSIGRNIFQSKDPMGMTRTIARMVFDGASIDEVYRG